MTSTEFPWDQPHQQPSRIDVHLEDVETGEDVVESLLGYFVGVETAAEKHKQEEFELLGPESLQEAIDRLRNFRSRGPLPTTLVAWVHERSNAVEAGLRSSRPCLGPLTVGDLYQLLRRRVRVIRGGRNGEHADDTDMVYRDSEPLLTARKEFPMPSDGSCRWPVTSGDAHHVNHCWRRYTTHLDSLAMAAIALATPETFFPFLRDFFLRHIRFEASIKFKRIIVGPVGFSLSGGR